MHWDWVEEDLRSSGPWREKGRLDDNRTVPARRSSTTMILPHACHTHDALSCTSPSSALSSMILMVLSRSSLSKQQQQTDFGKEPTSIFWFDRTWLNFHICTPYLDMTVSQTRSTIHQAPSPLPSSFTRPSALHSESWNLWRDHVSQPSFSFSSINHPPVSPVWCVICCRPDQRCGSHLGICNHHPTWLCLMQNPLRCMCWDYTSLHPVAAAASSWTFPCEQY